MPTYEYACKKCGEHFDAVQSFTDEPLKRHKGGCGGSVKRVFGSVGISFKGSGFYKTDNRSSSNGGKSASPEKSEPKSESKSETKPESKSEKKSDTKTSSSSAS
jgi:putative FmdB family regulatory protein